MFSQDTPSPPPSPPPLTALSEGLVIRDSSAQKCQRRILALRLFFFLGGEKFLSPLNVLGHHFLVFLLLRLPTLASAEPGKQSAASRHSVLHYEHRDACARSLVITSV